jgi:hypothetical protein
MKVLSQLVFGVVCAGIGAGICVGQERTSAGADAAAAGGTKSIVQGRVVQDPGGQGIRKVKIVLIGGSGQRREPYEAVTDETGQFKVPDVEPGTYLVQLQRSGYAASGKANRENRINVIGGQDTRNLLFHVLEAGVITGKIIDLDGDPLPNVSVTATASSGRATTRHPGHMGNAASNDLGEYRIADLPPGRYIVQATPPANEKALPSPNEKNASKGRLVYVTTYFPGTLDEQQAVPIAVPAGSTATANFGVQASRAYRVSGTVLGLKTELEPQSGARGAVFGAGRGEIILVGKNRQVNEQANQQNLHLDGRFDFPNVLAGTYRAQLILFDVFSGQEPSIKMQTIRTPIEVNGSDVLGLQLQVDPGSDVSGQFRTEGNEKIDWTQLQVMLIPKRGGEPEEMVAAMRAGNVMVTEVGSFEIKDVPAGSFQLAVGASSDKFRDYYTKSVLLGGREVADTGFDVSSGTVLDVIISAKGAGIEGTVVDREGKTFAGASVVSVPSSGKNGRPDAYQTDRTDEKGHFALRGMNPGEFLVVAFEGTPGDYRAAEFVKQYERKGQKVELEEGGKKSVVLKVIAEEEE